MKEVCFSFKSHSRDACVNNLFFKFPHGTRNNNHFSL